MNVKSPSLLHPLPRPSTLRLKRPPPPCLALARRSGYIGLVKVGKSSARFDEGLLSLSFSNSHLYGESL